MKIQIRENVFETNSSSTHCIAINKNNNIIYPEDKIIKIKPLNLSNREDKYFHTTEDRLSYLYSACSVYPDAIKQLESMLLECGGYTLSFEVKHVCYYIDSYSTEQLQEILTNKDMFVQFVFGNNVHCSHGSDEDDNYMDDICTIRDNDNDEWISINYNKNTHLFKEDKPVEDYSFIKTFFNNEPYKFISSTRDGSYAAAKYKDEFHIFNCIEQARIFTLPAPDVNKSKKEDYRISLFNGLIEFTISDDCTEYYSLYTKELIARFKYSVVTKYITANEHAFIYEDGREMLLVTHNKGIYDKYVILIGRYYIDLYNKYIRYEGNYYDRELFHKEFDWCLKPFNKENEEVKEFLKRFMIDNKDENPN